jgi:hypothetical protein
MTRSLTSLYGSHPPLAKAEHSRLEPRYETPEHCGRDLARHLLEALQFYGATTPEEVTSAIEHAASESRVNIDQRFLDERTQTHYGMADAARDLGVQCYWDSQIEIDKVVAEDQEP